MLISIIRMSFPSFFLSQRWAPFFKFSLIIHKGVLPLMWKEFWQRLQLITNVISCHHYSSCQYHYIHQRPASQLSKNELKCLKGKDRLTKTSDKTSIHNRQHVCFSLSLILAPLLTVWHAAVVTCKACLNACCWFLFLELEKTAVFHQHSRQILVCIKKFTSSHLHHVIAALLGKTAGYIMQINNYQDSKPV